MNKKMMIFWGVLFCCSVFVMVISAENFTEPVPLPELGSDTYLNLPGGLYPGGSNTVPSTYFANEIQPAYNQLKNDDKIVVLCLGMSNMKHACDALIDKANSSADDNPAVKIINAGQSGRSQKGWDGSVSDDVWDKADLILSRADESPGSVDVVLYFNAWGYPSDSDFISYAEKMQTSLESTMAKIASSYPNTNLIYITSREYAGYVVTDLNPDPWAYWDGFAFKWLVEDRINGVTSGPPLLWQAYQYDPTWPASYFRAGDGVHLSDEGLLEVGKLWFNFFLTQPWFGTIVDPSPTSTPTATSTTTFPPPPTATITPTPSATPFLDQHEYLPFLIKP